MKIRNLIHQGNKWVEYNPEFREDEKIGTLWGLDLDYLKKYNIEVFNKSNRIIVKKGHTETFYTVNQKNRGIEPDEKNKLHYHYYFAESAYFGTYICHCCQQKVRKRPKCCKDPTESFFEHRHSGGSCHACYDEQIELVCVNCFIQRDLFKYNCYLYDNGDYIVKN